MRILALPRDRNPYQQLLYGQFARRGHAIRYVGERIRRKVGKAGK